MYEEKAKIIFYIKKDKKKGKETKLMVRSINKRLSEEKMRRREGRKGQILTQQKEQAPRQEKEKQDNVAANECTTLTREQPYRWCHVQTQADKQKAPKRADNRQTDKQTIDNQTSG